MRRSTVAAYVIGGLALIAGVTANILHGKERSIELYSHEKTANAERIVYKINRWFVSPQYDITEFVPLNDLINQEFSKAIGYSGSRGINYIHPLYLFQ